MWQGWSRCPGLHLSSACSRMDRDPGQPEGCGRASLTSAQRLVWAAKQPLGNAALGHGSQRVGHNWATFTMGNHCITRGAQHCVCDPQEGRIWDTALRNVSSPLSSPPWGAVCAPTSHPGPPLPTCPVLTAPGSPSNSPRGPSAVCCWPGLARPQGVGVGRGGGCLVLGSFSCEQ